MRTQNELMVAFLILTRVCMSPTTRIGSDAARIILDVRRQVMMEMDSHHIALACDVSHAMIHSNLLEVI